MSSPALPERLRFAVCLFPAVTTLDYQGPIELFGFISSKRLDNPISAPLSTEPPKYAFDIEYLGHTRDPVEPISGPSVLPQRTYDEVLASKEQFDILLVPGGARPEGVPRSLTEFIRAQAPGARYILSVCTGSWVLAGAGILDGRKATTNKRAFNSAKVPTKDLPIVWVPKARWVVDGNVWTSSGVTAGADMANAFLQHLIGDEYAEKIRGVVELSAKTADDDPWAAYYDLV
ncbi:class I glutamine amidotransferase-like protein [Punctularia strigosozonata HHB-11173 SS5]|uniref:class I glutamine amidotransferase-like protein n=1 Tax=Punctularia strigosozonata (strain HHB-11173) TaxID=741275 RepID=UPI000441829C|nr:class I glutamine amidotransferase-like protein [Punctularia strigosozonata HHB-11173 SS5]EIN06460.1 class I glutamine amidotransferase-like protein [Punctularia strigosozonata HHB-11173 SS5]